MGVLFGLLLTKLVDLFSKAFLHATFKIAITLAFIVFIIAAIVAYVTAAGVIVTSLSQTVPDIVSGVWGWVMPSNTPACLTALSAAVLLRFFTNQYLALMRFKFKASLSN